jgi:hypothetical protein
VDGRNVQGQENCHTFTFCRPHIRELTSFDAESLISRLVCANPVSAAARSASACVTSEQERCASLLQQQKKGSEESPQIAFQM